jgi:hypothetical protein
MWTKMRISLISRFENTLSMLFLSLSASLFVLLILLLVKPAPYITSIVLSVIMCVLLIVVFRTYFKERRVEFFDISSPTLFESGVLVFKSAMKRCATFFAFKISAINIEKADFQRILTILLKILPTSTTVALEWTSQKECFINFYIKQDNSSFLTQTRELLDNITRSFNITFGTQCVHLLTGEELMLHFYMGIPGKLKKISVSGRHTIKIHTDLINTKRLFALITLTDFKRFSTVLNRFDRNQDFRLILPIKKTEDSIFIAKAFIFSWENPTKSNPIQTPHQNFSSLSKIPASKSIQILGDILSRNHTDELGMEFSLRDTATKIIDLLLIQWSSQGTLEVKSQTPQEPKTANVGPNQWRDFLIEQLSNLTLPYQKDKTLLIDEIPLRVDAQVEDLLIFIIPKIKENQVRWFVQNITTLLERDKTKNVILLLTQPQNTLLSPKGLSSLIRAQRIHFVRTKEELTSLLAKKKPHLLKRQKGLTQAA